MKIAVTYEAGQVFQHFGHTKEFKLYETEGEAVTGSQVVGAGEAGHGALAGFLQGQGVQVLICGGIGPGAQNALSQAGIRLVAGVSGGADQAVEQFLSGELQHNPDAGCAGHGHEHGHSCGGHDHGHSHHCGGSGHHCGS